MSTISGALPIQFSCPSFRFHFNLTSSTQNRPHASGMSVATRRVSPTLYPTPPPSASLPSIAGPSAPSKSNARHNFTLQQSHLPSGPSRVEDDGAKRESRVSKLTAQLVAQAQPCVCPWLCDTGCDAVLGSIDLLQRVCLFMPTV